MPTVVVGAIPAEASLASCAGIEEDLGCGCAVLEAGIWCSDGGNICESAALVLGKR